MTWGWVTVFRSELDHLYQIDVYYFKKKPQENRLMVLIYSYGKDFDVILVQSNRLFHLKSNQ